MKDWLYSNLGHERLWLYSNLGHERLWPYSDLGQEISADAILYQVAYENSLVSNISSFFAYVNVLMVVEVYENVN